MNRSKRQRLLSILVIFTILIACAAAPSGFPQSQPACAQGGEALQPWTIDIGQKLNDPCCRTAHFHWWRFIEEHFPQYDCGAFDGGAPVTYLSFPLYFDPQAGTISGTASGHGTRYDQNGGISFENGQLTNGWLMPEQDVGWDFGGTLALDATYECGTKCLDPATEQWVDVSRQETQHFDAELSGSIYFAEIDGQLVPDELYLHITGESPQNEEIWFSIHCPDCPAPPNIPTTSGLQSRRSELRASLNCTADEDAEGLICSASVQNATLDETFEYHWYIDSAFGGTTQSASVQIPSLPPGTHDIGVQVVGEGRFADVTITIGDSEEQIISDRDNDGIPDKEDVCPDQYAPYAWDGCPKEQVQEPTPTDAPLPTATPTLQENIIQWTLFGTGRIEDMEGWERLSVQQQENLRKLAEALNVLSRDTATSTAGDPGQGAAAQTGAAQWSGGTGGDASGSAELIDGGKQTEQQAVTRWTQVEQELQKKLRDGKTIMEEFHKAKYGETAYKAWRLASGPFKWGYDKYQEWKGITENPQQIMEQKYHSMMKEKGFEGSKQFLAEKGYLPANSPKPVTEMEFAKAVVAWAQGTTEAVVPIHYAYYRQVYDQNIPPGKDPTEDEKQQAHGMAMEALRTRLRGANEGTIEDDLTQSQFGELGPSGKLGKAWHPKYLDDVMGYWDAYETAFPKVNEQIDID